MGKAKRSELLTFAANFGSDTLLDERGVLYSAAGVQGVPGVFAVNSRLEVIGQSPLYGGLATDQLAEVMIQKLNLEK